jgi:hypothetical protein
LVREDQGCLKPFNWSIVITTLYYSTLSMQGRFKMEYRLFTIVRYNYRDYNTPSKPNMHAKRKQLYCTRLRRDRAKFREERKTTRKV